MKRRCYIKEVYCRHWKDYDGFSVELTCLTSDNQLITTSFVFDPDGPPLSPRRRKWGLMRAMARAYDVTIDNPADVSWMLGKFYWFDLEEWEDKLLIKQFKRCEPFDTVTDEQKAADFERWFKERSGEVF